jgi:lipoate-protein ligase A
MYKVTTAVSYTFTIDHVDGLFSTGSQTIYIKDNLDGSYHNITSSPHEFTSAVGTFSDLFELVYQNVLSANNNNFSLNSIVVYHEQNDVVINIGITKWQQ